MSTENIWKKFIEYVNSKKIGDTITRIELLENFGYEKKRSIPTTIDGYRLMLTNSGCLFSEARGRYRLDKKVESISLRQYRNKVYCK